MTYNCENCGIVEEDETLIIALVETIPVLGENITTTSNVRTCMKCGEELFDKELDEVSLQQAYDIYRKNHNIPLGTPLNKIKR